MLIEDKFLPVYFRSKIIYSFHPDGGCLRQNTGLISIVFLAFFPAGYFGKSGSSTLSDSICRSSFLMRSILNPADNTDKVIETLEIAFK